jgi:hypothetical protein
MAKNEPSFDFSEKLMSEYAKLMEAKALLDTVYSEVGGYGGMITPETLAKLNNFYGFDDSE